ncbi:MAG: hypothetical protein ABEJ35_06985 [Halobacteriaceae archaeon]
MSALPSGVLRPRLTGTLLALGTALVLLAGQVLRPWFLAYGALALVILVTTALCLAGWYAARGARFRTAFVPPGGVVGGLCVVAGLQAAVNLPVPHRGETLFVFAAVMLGAGGLAVLLGRALERAAEAF